jgi:ABC-2 type transport system permease protein
VESLPPRPVLRPLVLRLLRRGWAGLVSLLVLIALFMFVNPLVADSLGGPGGIEALLERLPPSLQALTRTRPELVAVSGLAGFLSIAFTHPVYMGIAAVALVGFAARSLAGEMERGTIQLALARPVSRSRVYLARVLGLLVVGLLLSAAGPLGMLVGLAVAQPEGEVRLRYFVPTAGATLLLFWAIGGLALLGSAAASTTGRCVAWATAGLVVFYFVDYLAELWDVLEPIAPFSIFDYFDPSRALVDGSLRWVDVAVLFGVGTFGAIGGWIVFLRRDLPV